MSTKYFLLACLLLALIPQQVLSSESDIDVKALMTYNKQRFSNKRQYMNDDEQIFRQSVFFDNLKKIDNHKINNREATYDIGLNQFSDMTDEEFSQRILNNYISEVISNTNKRVNGEDEAHSTTRGAGAAGQTVATSIDWRSKGVISPIKNQGSCGSCWTFSTTGILESFNAITNGKLTQFSEQQLLDCVTKYSYGCQGGWPTSALEYVQQNGIVTAAQYPYAGVQGRCRVTSKTSGFYLKSFQQVGQTSDALKAALNKSPVAVLVNASTMGAYRTGVFNGCGNTTQQQLNHAVIAVGYDVYGNWIVRNSWATTWGESGYIRLAPGNTCGILLSNQVISK